MFKKITLSFFLICSTIIYAQVGIGTITPADGAILDVDSDSGGIMIPRVELTATNVVAPIISTFPTPEVGLLVYNTNTAGTAPNNVTPGFYFWNGIWERIASGASTDWSLTGNAGTTAGTNFIGTSDSQPLRIRTNNTEQFEITTDGQVRANNSGSQAAPIYSFDQNNNMGMYRSGNNDLRFATGGNGRLQITNTFLRSFQNHRFANGTAEAPAINFNASQGTGIFRPAADNLAFSTNGAERMRVNAIGNVGINTNAPTYRFHVSNNSANIGATALANSENSGEDGVALSGVNSNTSNGFNSIEGATGYNLTTFITSGVFGFALATTGNGIGVRGNSNSWQGVGVRGSRVNSGGPDVGWGGLFFNDLGYTGGFFNASDSRLKKKIQPINNAISILKKLNPVTYFYDIEKYNSLGFNKDLEYGLIAQEVKEILPTLVKEKSLFISSKLDASKLNTSEEGSIQNFLMIDYTRLIPITLKAIQEQQEIIDNQESRIAKLEALVNELLNKK